MINAVCMCLVIDDTTKEIVYRDYVDISVAVATPKVRQMHYIVMQSVKCFIAHLSFKVKSWRIGNATSLSGSGGSCNPKCRGDEFC